MRRGIPSRLYVAGRRILAMTCIGCGQLRQGSEFGRSSKGYVDRRCTTTCRWARMEASPGR